MNSLKAKILTIYEKYMMLMGIGGHLIFVLQAKKILLNKSAENVSLEGFVVAFVSILSWFIYGILKQDKVLMIVNAVGLLVSASCIVLILIY
jgi:MtN3 and saliva related transmembrane protein